MSLRVYGLGLGGKGHGAGHPRLGYYRGPYQGVDFGWLTGLL